MAQHNHAGDEQETTIICANDADTTGHGEQSDEPTYDVADLTDTLDDYRAGVSEGDYLAVVYQTPSNGASLQRVMGTVVDVDPYDTGNGVKVTFDVEDGSGDGPTGDEETTACLFLNDSDSYRFDDGRQDPAMGGYPVDKWAWTPK